MMPPSLLLVEIIHTVLIMILCLIIYTKTKDMYGLTKHKGIGHFRNAFLFFALAYLFRFLFMMFRFSWVAFDTKMIHGFMWPANLLILGYFGTLAILSLTLSTIWKKINIKQSNLFIHLISGVIALLALITFSTTILLYTQIALIIFTIIMLYKSKITNKKTSNNFLIYLLLFVFWLINIFVLSPRTFVPFEIKIVTFFISGLIFIIIYHKVRKWVQ